MRELSSEELYEKHRYARQLYSEARGFMTEVEEVWKGEFGLPSGVEDSPLQIVRPSDGYTLIDKMEKLIAVRSDQRINVLPYSDSMDEAKRVDKLDRFLRAHDAEEARVSQQNWRRSLVSMALLRGRAAVHTLYMPEQNEVKVRRLVLDPMEYSPVMGMSGVEWFTIEKRMKKWELFDYFKSLSFDMLEQMDIPDEHDPKLFGQDEITIVQYWDKDQFAWAVVGGGGGYAHKVQSDEHGYGMVTLREVRLGSKPLNDPRWNSMPFLGPVMEDIKQKAILETKMATGVEMAYFPLILFKDPNNGISRFDPYAPPGSIQHLSPEAEIQQFNVQPNHQVLELLRSTFQQKISKGTLSELAWATEINNPSGFATNQVLSILKDDLADIRDGIEQCFGLVYGDVLRLHELFAPAEGWEYPMKKPSGGAVLERIRPEDIDGHHRVDVAINVALPQDTVQKGTIFNLLYQPGPDGKYRIDWETALQLSGLADDIEDHEGMRRRIEWYWAKQNDEELAALDIARIKADYAREIEASKREVEKDARRQERLETTRTARDVERGLSDDVVIPAEIASDPQKLQQLVQMALQGMPLKDALAALEQSGLPLGVPGMPPQEEQPPGQMSPETMQIMQALGGSGQPDAFTGYEGVSPAAMPPAMAGALPRQSLDRDRVAIEQVERDQRRGALPPPK